MIDINQVVAVALPPNAQLALSVAAAAIAAVQAAQNNGIDVTDEQLKALFDQFEVNKADDLKTQQNAAPL